MPPALTTPPKYGYNTGDRETPTPGGKMDTTIPLSTGLATSALTLAAGILDGSLIVEPGPDLDSVISDLRTLRAMIVEASNR